MLFMTLILDICLYFLRKKLNPRWFDIRTVKDHMWTIINKYVQWCNSLVLFDIMSNINYVRVSLIRILDILKEITIVNK